MGFERRQRSAVPQHVVRLMGPARAWHMPVPRWWSQPAKGVRPQHPNVLRLRGQQADHPTQYRDANRQSHGAHYVGWPHSLSMARKTSIGGIPSSARNNHPGVVVLCAPLVAVFAK